MGVFRKWTQTIWVFGDPREDEKAKVKKPPTEPKKKVPMEAKVERLEPEYDLNPTPYIPKKPTCCDYLLLDRRIRLLYVFLLCALLGVGIPILISYLLSDYHVDLSNCNADIPYRFECLSGSGTIINQKECQNAGCCWNATISPKCFHRNPTRYRYQIQSGTHCGASGGDQQKCRVFIQTDSRSNDPFGNLMNKAKLVIQAVNPKHLVIQILKTDENEEDFRLVTPNLHTPLDESDFLISYESALIKSAAVIVARKQSGEVIFDSSRGPLIFSDSYVEWSTLVPTNFLYGLGQERRSTLHRRFDYSKSALYNRKNVDGFHPFFMAFERNASSAMYGFYWETHQPLEIQFNPGPSLSFRTTGGPIKIHLFSGPRPEDVSEQFMKDIIGPIQMPPFWALGFHLCREADDEDTFRKTFQDMGMYGIGLDSDCIDSRLSGPASMAIDVDTFQNVMAHRELLRNNNTKFLLTQPPHVLLDRQDQFPFPFISFNESSYVGMRMNSSVLFPSFPHLNQQVQPLQINWNDILNPDGIFLIDNWPLNEDDDEGNCLESNKPFLPDRIRPSINSQTVCSSAVHESEIPHIDLHNIYGVQHLNVMPQSNDGRRIFYLNRAAALGNLGRAGYFGDDFTANWLSMKTALIQVLEMSLYGIPTVGAPICGSLNSTTIDIVDVVDEEQLCLRWYQWGLLLPWAQSFSRVGHWLRSPVDLSPTSRRSIGFYVQLRYSLLPYYYTLHYQASVRGTPVVRPLFYEFPGDNETYLQYNQFMIGHSLMVCPVLIQDPELNSVAIQVYFPNGTWYDYYTGQVLAHGKGHYDIITTPQYHINIFIRQNTIFVNQEPGHTAEATRANHYAVTVAFSEENADPVVGYLYVDDGWSTDREAYDYIQFQVDRQLFNMSVIHRGLQPDQLTSISTVVDRIRCLGFEKESIRDLLHTRSDTFNVDYNEASKTLDITGLDWDWSRQDTYILEFHSNSE